MGVGVGEAGSEEVGEVTGGVWAGKFEVGQSMGEGVGGVGLAGDSPGGVGCGVSSVGLPCEEFGSVGFGGGDIGCGGLAVCVGEEAATVTQGVAGGLGGTAEDAVGGATSAPTGGSPQSGYMSW